MAKKSKAARKPVKRRRAVKKPARRAPSAREVGALYCRDRALSSLEFAHSTLRTFIDDFPAERRLHQPSPTDNHVLWNVGHLACYYVFSTNLLGGQPHALPAVYEERFQYQTKAVADAAAYPSFDEVRANCEAAYERLVTVAKGLTASDLLKKVALPGMESYADDRLDALERAAWHEGWHTGQVSAIRRAIGLKPKF